MKEYSIQVIKLAEKLNLIKMLSRYAGKIPNKNKIDYDIIVNATSFLTHNPIFRERLYCIINDIHSRILCKECGINHVKFNKRKYLIFCSIKCAGNNITVKEKRKQTWNGLYGCDHPWLNPKIQQKRKETIFLNHGTIYPMTTTKSQEKNKKTCLDRYNVEFIMQHEEIKNQIKKTNIKRYGFEHASQSKIIQQKRSKTISIIYHKRFLKICNEKYDKHYAYPELKQSHDEISIWCKDHGEFKTIMYSHMNGQECPICKPTNKGFSRESINWIEYIMEIENIYIQHAMNIGEYKINISDFNKRGYTLVDGYCKENNTIYEFLGDFWHGNPKKFLSEDVNIVIKKSYGELYNNTIYRLNILKSLGYNVISIWESDWNKMNK